MKLAQKLKSAPVLKEIPAVCSLIGKRKVAANAAGLSFYLFLSMIPLLILLCSLLPYTGVTARELTDVVTRLTPDALNGLLTSLIVEAYASRVSVFSLSCVFLLWSATKLSKALIRALNEIYGQEEQRGFISLTLRSVAFTAALVLLIVVLLLAIVRGHTAEELLDRLLEKTELSGVWSAIGKRLAAVAVCAPLFALLYTAVPYGKRNYLRQLPGAMAAAAAVTLFSLVFSVYSAGSNIYNSFYGSLTAVALLLFYVYICFQLLLIGGVLNAYIAGRGVGAEQPPEA